MVPGPNRTQDRSQATELMSLPVTPTPAAEQTDATLTSALLGITRGSSGVDSSPGLSAASGRFHNEPTPTRPCRRTGPGVVAILGRVAASTLGSDTIAASQVTDAATLDALIASVSAAGRAWGQRTGSERAAILHRAGLALAANRDRLIEVAASETGKTIAEADPEISEAIDFAHYYAERAIELDEVQGALFVPAQLTVVTPPWNFPVAIPAGGGAGGAGGRHPA